MAKTFGQLEEGDSIWQFSPSLNRVIHYTLKDTQIHSGRNYIVLVMQTGTRTVQRIVLETVSQWGSLFLTREEAVDYGKSQYASTLENKSAAIHSHEEAIKALHAEARETQALLEDFIRHADKAVETLPETQNTL